MPVVRQWLGKHIPEVTLSIIEGNPLLGNGPINTHSRQQTVFSMESVQRNCKRAQSEELEEYNEYERVKRSSLVLSYFGSVLLSVESQPVKRRLSMRLL
jgi:hypothetical protein